MAGMLIPEGIVEDVLQKALEYIRTDYNSFTDKSKTLLARITDNKGISTFNYTEQLAKSLITTKRDPKHIEIKQSYDPDDRTYPSVYINMNSESESNSSLSDGLGDHGLSGGDYMYFDDESPIGNETDIFAKRYDSSMYITIISDNKNEAIGLYHFFKMLLLSVRRSLNEEGLQNVKTTGKGVNFDSRIPPGVMIKVIDFSFNYDSYSYDFYSRIVPSTINLTGTLTT